MNILLLQLIVWLCIFATTTVIRESRLGHELATRIESVVFDPGLQWAILLIAVAYLFVFAFLCRPLKANRSRLISADTLLTLALAALLYNYAINYSVCVQSGDLVVFICSAVIAKFCHWATRRKTNTTQPLIFIVILNLAIGAMWNVKSSPKFVYHGHFRWCGPWDNPNIYGAMMAVALVLLCGTSVALVSSATSRRWLKAAYLIAAVLLIWLAGTGLLNSYSRGGWMAAAAGLTYFFFSILRLQSYAGLTYRLFKKHFLFSLGVAALYIALISLNGEFVGRAGSISNPNEFSWRNRIGCWTGLLEELADSPLAPARLPVKASFENFYSDPGLLEFASIKLNDYLTLGLLGGAPCLVCFLSYLFFRFQRSWREVPARLPRQSTPEAEADFYALASRAGCIALLVSFAFNGGLFDLSTAALFWILLEFGCAEPIVAGESVMRFEGHQRDINGRPIRKVLKTVMFIFVASLALSASSVMLISFGTASISTPILLYHHDVSGRKAIPRHIWVNWRDISPYFLTEVWISEDARFFEHNGFDWTEIRLAWEESQRTGIPARGASTITQQCARSVFLWQGRSWVRKSLEAYYTVLMELMLPKKRILELYVNAIEFGDGIYGLEAAARHYYHKQAKDLTREEAAMLVAIMPKPREWDPLHPIERVLKRQKVILDRSANVALPIRIGNEEEHSGEAEGSQKKII